VSPEGTGRGADAPQIPCALLMFTMRTRASRTTEVRHCGGGSKNRETCIAAGTSGSVITQIDQTLRSASIKGLPHVSYSLGSARRSVSRQVNANRAGTRARLSMAAGVLGFNTCKLIIAGSVRELDVEAARLALQISCSPFSRLPLRARTPIFGHANVNFAGLPSPAHQQRERRRNTFAPRHRPPTPSPFART